VQVEARIISVRPEDFPHYCRHLLP